MAYTVFTNCLCNVCAGPCAMQCAGPTGTGTCDTSIEGGQGSVCNAPQFTGEGGCGCVLVESDGHVGALAILGIVFSALARQRRRR